MKRKLAPIMMAILATAQVLTCAVPAQAAESEVPAAEDVFHSLEKSLSCEEGELLTTDNVLPGDSVSDWLAFDAGQLGMDGADTYLEKIEDWVTETYAEKGCLDTIQTTEYYRTILAVLSLGGDPTACGEDQDGNAIDLVDDGIYHWSGESLGMQGNNGWIYALIALDASDTEAPEDANFTREDILCALLEQEGEDGSFGLTKGGSDIDLTAMAVQALALYALDGTEVSLSDGSQVNVSDAVQRSLDWLSSQQKEDGGFAYEDEENTESAAQVIMALSCLGKDPQTDPQFVKEGGNVLSSMLSFRLEDGTFCHVQDDKSNAMATEQATRALLSIEKRSEQDLGLYEQIRPASTGQTDSQAGDSSTEVQTADSVASTDTGIPVTAIVIVLIVVGCAAAVIIVVVKRKKSEGK